MADTTFDVIVVLGAAQNPDGTPGAAISRRVRHAAGCYHHGRAPWIMLCGGVTVVPVSEARTMADIARVEGVPETALILEEVSTRTLGNAEHCRRVMADHGLRRALLVTDWFHMPRALYTFRAFGIDVSPEAVPAGWSRALPAALFKEGVANIDYRVRVPRYLAGRA